MEFGGVLKAAAPVKPMDKYIAQEMMMENQMTWVDVGERVNVVCGYCGYLDRGRGSWMVQRVVMALKGEVTDDAPNNFALI
jgi:hypothetical protein